MKRKRPTLTEKLAACLIELKLVNRDWAKGKTAQEICDCVQWDHFPIRVEMGGTNHPTNLQPLLIKAHADKTFKKDIPEIAKSRRILKKHKEFRERLLKPEAPEWPKLGKRKIGGWKNRKYKRKVDGTVVERKAS